MPTGSLEESLRLFQAGPARSWVFGKISEDLQALSAHGPLAPCWAQLCGGTDLGQNRSRVNSSESLLEGNFLIFVYMQPVSVCQCLSKTYTGVYLCFPKNRIWSVNRIFLLFYTRALNETRTQSIVFFKEVNVLVPTSFGGILGQLSSCSQWGLHNFIEKVL